MKKRTISLSVDERVYKEYQEFCKQQGIVMSKQIEKFMQEFIDQIRK